VLQQSPVVTNFDDKLARVDTLPQVVAAERRFYGCVGKHGIHISSIDGFFNYADSKLVPLLEKRRVSQARAIERALTKVFVPCMTPLEQLRDRVRAQERSSYFASHALAIQAIRQKADRVEAAVQRAAHRHLGG
jgi:hypothetical protein